jgi:3-hydroxyacyl-[acyl-carrier-protein] dehydratase
VRFVLIDDIVALTPGKTITCAMTMREDEELFRDHFPGFPVVPGVLLTEMIGQAAALCLAAEDESRGKAVLVQIQRASFRRWVRPGERADIAAAITASTADYARASGTVAVAGEDAASADLLFSFIPRTRLASDFRDLRLDEFRMRQRVARPEP